MPRVSSLYFHLTYFYFFPLPWELLYVDDLVVIVESEEDLIKKLN